MKTGATTNGASRSTGTTARGRSTKGSGSGGEGEVARWFDESVCAFWLGDHCYGVVSSLVGEVFLVEACAPVPLAPPAVLGLFNLRGTPVALIDLAMVLELSGAGAAGPEPEEGRGALALVLRTPRLLVGARIRKMEVVIASGRGLYTPPDGGADEHPVVAGFLELPDRPDLTITLLHPDALCARLDRLRYLEAEET